MNETVNLRYEPVGEGQFPLLGKVYAEAWKGSSSAFAPSAYRKKQTAEKAAERFKKQAKREKNLRFFLICRGKEPIGMYATSLYPDRTGELRKLYLLPAYCGRGYGMEVLLHILWENRELDELFLWVPGANERAFRFYQKCGFAATGDEQEVAPEIGLSKYKMVLKAPLDVRAAVIRILLRESREAHASALQGLLAGPQPEEAEKPAPAPTLSGETADLFAGWLAALCGAGGVAGDEGNVAKALSRILSRYTSDIEIDPFQNVIARIRRPGENEPHILLDAHIDEIGMLVQKTLKNGFVRCVRDGGIDPRLTAGQEVTLHGARDIPGVVVPPADGKLPASDGVLIDTGLSEEELKETLTPGDMVTFRGPFTRLGERRFTAKALDDRSCAAAILYALELTKGEELPCGVSVLFSSQEEIGGHGAKVAAERLRPDQAIASDVSFALTPDADPDECGKMGDGAMIGVAPVLDRPMTEALKALAGEKGIPYQLELMGGRTGTNADAIFCTGGGVRTALISLPQKYMHSPIEIVDAGDIAAVGRLMAEYLRHPLPAARKEEA